MITSDEIKSIVLGLGADKCGIASIDGFSSAPTGFRPTDVYSKCKSVVVFLKRMPPEVIMAENPVPYSHTAYLLYSAIDQIGLNLCSELGNHGIQVVPVPTDVPYLQWDAENKHGMGIISMRHAAFNSDEFLLARRMNIPVWTLSTITASIALIILAVVIFKFIPIKQRLTFMLSGIVGGVSGYLLWQTYLGKTIMP